MSVYQTRRDIIVEGLKSLGWPICAPKATLYVWVPVPQGYSSAEFVTLLLDKCGIIVPQERVWCLREGFSGLP
jgi:LL-diaminopimelate aminotransferase